MNQALLVWDNLPASCDDAWVKRQVPHHLLACGTDAFGFAKRHFSKGGRRFGEIMDHLSKGVLSSVTLPETNIAHENPPF